MGLSPAQIGQTWLNDLIERRTILWWGGLGNSTEHTAYLRLKHGVAAFEVRDPDHPLRGGGIALVCEEGRLTADAVAARPAAVELGVELD